MKRDQVFFLFPSTWRVYFSSKVDAPASTTPQFPAPPHSATTLQNVLVRLLTSMPSRDQAVHTATGISQPSGPMTSAGNDSNAKEVHKVYLCFHTTTCCGIK